MNYRRRYIAIGAVLVCATVAGVAASPAFAAYRGTLTQGSVVFTGANGGDTQDNANFFWDATNLRLGIGTTSPTATLAVGSNSGSASSGHCWRSQNCCQQPRSQSAT